MLSFEENEKSGKTERTIHDIEEAIQRTDDLSKKGMLFKAAGDAYYSGLLQAPKDEAKALEYYTAGKDCGNVECMYSYGLLYVANYWGKDKILFSAGVCQLCKSYTLGYEPAKQPLEELIKTGLFPGCNSIEDLLEIGGLSEDVGSEETKMPDNSSFYSDSSVKPKMSSAEKEKGLMKVRFGMCAGIISITFGKAFIDGDLIKDWYGYVLIIFGILIIICTIPILIRLNTK